MTDTIKSVADLEKLRDAARRELELRTGPKTVQVNVHMGTCGIAAGARDVLAELVDELQRAGLTDVTLRQSGCAGLCSFEPMLTLTDGAGVEFHYGKLDRGKVRDIVREHLAGGHPAVQHLIRV